MALHKLVKILVFQLTRPRGARLAFLVLRDAVFRFNSRARVGRDTHYDCYFDGIDVSTHAPAWGATGALPMLTVTNWVSTHAPAWGATIAEAINNTPDEVSTHAPAWGATLG